MNAKGYEDAPEEEVREGTGAIDEVQLGDGLARDQQLAGCLQEIAETVEDDAPGTSAYLVHELIAVARDWGPRAWAAMVKAVSWGVSRFTRVEESRANARAIEILAGAEAYKIKVEADAGAVLISAQADQIRKGAEASLEQAKAAADALRADTRRKDDLLRRINSKGIDFMVELGDDGVLRVVYTKAKPAKKLPPHDSE